MRNYFKCEICRKIPCVCVEQKSEPLPVRSESAGWVGILLNKGDKQMTGSKLIMAERRRQIEKEDWSEAHDDGHQSGELRQVAAMCALDGTDMSVEGGYPTDWGLINRHGIDGTKPDQIKLLSIAGALIAAEIDRLLRMPSNENK